MIVTILDETAFRWKYPQTFAQNMQWIKDYFSQNGEFTDDEQDARMTPKAGPNWRAEALKVTKFGEFEGKHFVYWDDPWAGSRAGADGIGVYERDGVPCGDMLYVDSIREELFVRTMGG